MDGTVSAQVLADNGYTIGQQASRTAPIGAANNTAKAKATITP
ncbi:hypothetical protein [Candidatus Poriferisocius sp.]